MVEVQRLVERELRAVDRGDQPLLGLRAASSELGWKVFFVLVLPRGGGEDDAVADAPAADGFDERDRRVARGGGRAELDPGAGQRRAVEIHAAAAADDGRARFLVHALVDTSGG